MKKPGWTIKFHNPLRNNYLYLSPSVCIDRQALWLSLCLLPVLDVTLEVIYGKDDFSNRGIFLSLTLLGVKIIHSTGDKDREYETFDPDEFWGEGSEEAQPLHLDDTFEDDTRLPRPVTKETEEDCS